MGSISLPTIAAVGALAASGASLGSTIANATSGGPSISGAGGGSPFLYQPTGQPQQDQTLQAIINQMSQTGQALPQQLLPGYQQASQNITNNPYAGLAQGGANQVAGLGMGTVAPWQLGGAGALYGGANQILGNAFDPQQALYNRTQQQLVDQINAANAASGLSGPAAAGVAQQGLTNFNIDWQNNLLNRQIAGLTGAGRGFAGAGDLGNLGLSTLGTASGLPYSTYLGQQRDVLGGLDALSRGANAAFSLPQMAASNIESYLGLGQAAGANALAGQAQGFNQSQIMGQGLASAFSNPALTSSLNQLFAPPQSSFTGGGNIMTGGFLPAQGGLGPAYLPPDPFAGVGNTGTGDFGNFGY